MNDPMLLEAGLIPQLPLQQTQSLSDYEFSESDSIHSVHSKEEEIVAGDSSSKSSAQEVCYAAKRRQYEMQKRFYQSNPQSFKQQHEATSLLQAPPSKKQKVMGIEPSQKSDEVAEQLFSVVKGQLHCALDVEDVKLIQELSPRKVYDMALVDLMRSAATFIQKCLDTHGAFTKAKSFDEEVECLKKIITNMATEVNNLQNRLSKIKKSILGHQETERSLKEALTTNQKNYDTERGRLEQERDEMTRKLESLEKRVKEMEEENYKAWDRGYETCKENVSQCYPNLDWAQIEKEGNSTLDQQVGERTSTS